MKKVFLIVLSLAALGFLASSCSKNSTCKCTEYYHGSYNTSVIFDTEGEGVKNCSQLEDRLTLKYGGNGYSYSCSKL